MGVPRGLRPYLIPRIPNRENPLTQPEVLAVMKNEHLRYVKNVTVGQLSIPDLGVIPGVEDSGGYMMNRDEVLDLSQWGKDILRSRNLSIAIQTGCVVPIPSPEDAGQFPSATPDSSYYTPDVSHPQLALASPYDDKLVKVEEDEQKLNDRLRGKISGSRLAQRKRDEVPSGAAPGVPVASSVPGTVQRPEELQQGGPGASVPPAEPPMPPAEGNPEDRPLQPEDFKPGPVPTPQREPGDDSVDEGRKFFASGDYQAALDMLKQGLEMGVSVKGSVTALISVAEGKLAAAGEDEGVPKSEPKSGSPRSKGGRFRSRGRGRGNKKKDTKNTKTGSGGQGE